MIQASIPPQSDLDFYRMARGQIEFEDGLITQRLSWFVAAQSFLFTAYAIDLNGPPQAAGTQIWAQHKLVFNLIPVVAIASCALIYMGILVGIAAQRRLRNLVHFRIPAETLAQYPLLHGSVHTRLGGRAAPLGLPPVFVTVWIILFVRGFTLWNAT